MTEIEQLYADVAFWHDAHARVDADRIKAEERARRATEIVQAVANVDDKEIPEACPHCGAEQGYVTLTHTPDCPVTKARAVLASE